MTTWSSTLASSSVLISSFCMLQKLLQLNSGMLMVACFFLPSITLNTTNSLCICNEHCLIVQNHNDLFAWFKFRFPQQINLYVTAKLSMEPNVNIWITDPIKRTPPLTLYQIYGGEWHNCFLLPHFSNIPTIHLTTPPFRTLTHPVVYLQYFKYITHIDTCGNAIQYKSQMGWLVRMPDTQLPKRLFYGELLEGKCSQGGQKKGFKASLKSLDIAPNSWETVALDCPTLQPHQQRSYLPWAPQDSRGWEKVWAAEVQSHHHLPVLCANRLHLSNLRQCLPCSHWIDQLDISYPVYLQYVMSLVIVHDEGRTTGFLVVNWVFNKLGITVKGWLWSL